jgi:hypothetical protein
MALLFVWRLANLPSSSLNVLLTNGHAGGLRNIIMVIIFEA